MSNSPSESRTFCGYIAIVGRPNVGKSTLLNHLLRQKISITSRKPQTTRHRILGISSCKRYQCVFVDTPGLHATEYRKLNRVMNDTVAQVIKSVDIILFLVDKTNSLMCNPFHVMTEALRVKVINTHVGRCVTCFRKQPIHVHIFNIQA